MSAAVPPTVTVVEATRSEPPPGLLEELDDDVELRFADTAGDLREALPGAEVALVADFRSGLLETAWDRADDLRWVHANGAGVDAVLFPGLRDSGVVLTNARGVFEGAIAEYVLGLMLAFAKDLPRTLRRQAERRWDHRESERLAGRRVVVVGAGPIGCAIGRLAGAVGLEVAGVARQARDDHPALGRVAAADDLTAAVSTADFVVLAVPLTAETEGMIGPEELAAMPRHARLINIARGPVVDQRALVAALEGGELAGAGLDVFETEPLPADSPLWARDDVIVSPHMSGDFLGWRRALTDVFVDNLRRWRRGDPLRNVVDKQRGYVPTDDDAPAARDGPNGA